MRRVLTLSLFVTLAAAGPKGAAVDMTIFDPIGGNEADYRRCYDIIYDHLERSYPAIREAIDAARSGAGRASDQGEGTDG